MPKNQRSGQAATLAPELLELLWVELTQPHRVITQICYYTASRVGEVCALTAEDILNGCIVVRPRTTKTKRSKTVPICAALQKALDEASLPEKGQLFPAHPRTKCDRKIYRRNSKKSTLERNHFDVVGTKPPSPHIGTRAVDMALRNACRLLSVTDSRFQGVSTHSFRRSAITRMARENTPLRDIQSISGHASLVMLQRYIDVTEQQKVAAVGVL